jgi:hypothetical protein
LENVPAEADMLPSDELQGEASGVYSSWGQVFRRYNFKTKWWQKKKANVIVK